MADKEFLEPLPKKFATATEVGRVTIPGLLRRPDIIGAGIGFKLSQKEVTDEPCIVAFVRRKIPKQLLHPQDFIPPEINGVKTDIVQVNPRALISGTASVGPPIAIRLRPARPGCSIGHYDVTAGTFGLVTKDRATGLRMILGNNHVLSNSNSGIPGDPVLQPGVLDGGHLLADTIAKLRRRIPLKFIMTSVTPWGSAPPVPTGVTNIVDCAIAQPLEEGDVSPDILNIGVPAGVRRPWPPLDVQKCGRTTGHTNGMVVHFGVTIAVDYGAAGTAEFSNAVAISGHGFSAGGDSGSSILDMQNNVTCLLFAGDESEGITFANDIFTVLEMLEQDLVTTP